MKDAIKILIIDDDKDSTAFVKEFLSVLGYTVFFASNAKDGIKICEEAKPNLLILDVILDSKPLGLRLLSTLKSNPVYRTFPIIILAKNQPVFGMDLKEAIADDRFNPNVTFIAKPIKMEILHKKILELI